MQLDPQKDSEWIALTILKLFTDILLIHNSVGFEVIILFLFC